MNGSGFPTGEGVGRIGLAVVNDQVVYAIHDNQFRRDEEKATQNNSDMLQKEDFKSMSTSQFLALDNNKLKQYLRQNGFQEKYRPENVKNMVRSGTVKPEDLAKYLEDANSMLFDTPVIGAEVYKSTDGGKSWKIARFVGPDLGKYAWRQFVLETTLASGTYTLASLASNGTDKQPELRMENRRGYAHNGWKDHSVQITVV